MAMDCNSDPTLKNGTTGNIGRRALLVGAASVLGSAATAATLPSLRGNEGGQSGSTKALVGGSSVVASADTAIAETSAGKVAGYIHKGIFTFKGIPYAATTEGASRFLPTSKPAPWTGVRSSRHFGYVAPQAPRAGWANDEESFLFLWDDGIQGEDCLRVNLWTPGINDGKKAGKVHSSA